jgi:hypothetical protein
VKKYARPGRKQFKRMRIKKEKKDEFSSYKKNKPKDD